MKQRGQDPSNVSRETPPDEETWLALERWLGLRLSGVQRDALVTYGEWLATEALQAGGIGPGERTRLYDRHVFDSLGYLRGLQSGEDRQDIPRSQGVPRDGDVVDVGAGVGLPGIPMAIAVPWLTFTLVDRSDRRTFLARRAVRILGLENVEVQTIDAGRLDQRFDTVVFRASLPIPQAATTFQSLATQGGTGLLGVSRREAAPVVPSPPDGVAYDLTSEWPGVLDSPFWLLRMRRT